MKKKHIFIILNIITFLLLLIVCVRENYPKRILTKFGFVENEEKIDWSRKSFNNCIEQLDYDFDIVFIGDSLTYSGDFQNEYCDKKIINLGLVGDTISGVKERSYVISNLKPEKIFILCGINSLNENNYNDAIVAYEQMAYEIFNCNQGAQLYIQSVLPVSKEKEEEVCSNVLIDKFNKELKKLCNNSEYVYLDINSRLKNNGYLNEEYSLNGIHINEKGYKVWYEILDKYVYENGE